MTGLDAAKAAKALEIFEQYKKNYTIKFQRTEKYGFSFCNNKCENCSVKNECDKISRLYRPLLSYEFVKKNYPEALI